MKTAPARANSPMMAVDTFIRGNGSLFYRSAVDDKPRLEIGDYFASPDPLPDDEASWAEREAAL